MQALHISARSVGHLHKLVTIHIYMQEVILLAVKATQNALLGAAPAGQMTVVISPSDIAERYRVISDILPDYDHITHCNFF